MHATVSVSTTVLILVLFGFANQLIPHSSPAELYFPYQFEIKSCAK